MNDIAVRATELTETYREGETEVHALKEVNFEIPRGDERNAWCPLIAKTGEQCPTT